MPESEVHSNILNLLADAMDKRIFEDIVPELITLNYLGPDPEEELVLAEVAGSSNQDSSAIGLVFGVTFCAALVLLMMLIAFSLSRDEIFRKLRILFCKRRTVPTSDLSSDEVIALDTASPS